MRRLLHGVAPMLDRHLPPAIEGVRPARDVARRADVGIGIARLGERPAGRVAGQPARVGAQAPARQPRRVADGPEGDDDAIRRDEPAVVQVRPGDVAPLSREGADLRAGAIRDARPAQAFDDRPADEGPEHAGQGRRIGIGQRHRHAEVAAAGGGLAADQPRADDEDVPGRSGEGEPQGGGIVPAANGEQSGEVGALPRPGAGPRPRRDQELGVGHLAAVAEADRLASGRGRWRAGRGANAPAGAAAAAGRWPRAAIPPPGRASTAAAGRRAGRARRRRG